MTNKGDGTILQNWVISLEDLNFIGDEYAVCYYLAEAERSFENYLKLPKVLEKTGQISIQRSTRLSPPRF